jgi:hypothetical protein
MGKRPQRDPGAPKRNMSAYLLYQNAMREHFKSLNPGMTFGQLAKYTSASKYHQHCITYWCFVIQDIIHGRC